MLGNMEGDILLAKGERLITLSIVDPNETKLMIDTANALQKKYEAMGYICSRSETTKSIVLKFHNLCYLEFTENRNDSTMPS